MLWTLFHCLGSLSVCSKNSSCRHGFLKLLETFLWDPAPGWHDCITSFVSCTLMLPVSCSTTSTGFTSGDCGGNWSLLNSLSWSWNQFETFTLWYFPAGSNHWKILNFAHEGSTFVCCRSSTSSFDTFIPHHSFKQGLSEWLYLSVSSDQSDHSSLVSLINTEVLLTECFKCLFLFWLNTQSCHCQSHVSEYSCRWCCLLIFLLLGIVMIKKFNLEWSW